MDDLQNLIQTYLQSEGFKLLRTEQGFVVADKLGRAADRDTLLVWIPPPSTKVKDFRLLESELLAKFKELTPQYPSAKYFLVTHTLEGFSKDFRSETKTYQVNMRVPIQFFDTPFKQEESPEAASTIKTILDLELHQKRVLQPFGIQANGVTQAHDTDLLAHLSDELIKGQNLLHKNPCLRIVVGAAGIGKSVLFQALFTRLYKHFIDQKRKHNLFHRPIPLIPEYLQGITATRTEGLIANFIHTDVASPVSRPTFEWMLVNGFSIWLFDGLDELYAGDADFFDIILDMFTRSESRAQILICARDSLLTTSDNFTRFLDDYQSGPEETVRVYKLSDWQYVSKRSFAWHSLKEQLPTKGQEDPPEVLQFLNKISSTKSLKSLSGLPYYCHLLMEEFKLGKSQGGMGIPEFKDEFELLEHVVSGIIKREIDKGLLSMEQFDGGETEFIEWLGTIAIELYEKDFTELSKSRVEEYAKSVLVRDLPQDQYSHALTTLIQFPLLAPGTKPGVITYKHELLGEYLAARYLLKRIIKDPARYAERLGSRLDFADSLMVSYIASRLSGQQESMQLIITTLKTGELRDIAFANLLQLVLLSTPAHNVITDNQIILEGKDLRGVKFANKDLRNVSFRNCNLSNSLFKNCNLQNAQFEGATLVQTSFEILSEDSLSNARFGNMQNFESISAGNQRIDDRNKMIKWVQKITGRTEKIQEPCAATFQLRTLFLKYFRQGGSAHRRLLCATSLSRGTRHPNAPSPEDCIKACLRLNFLHGPDSRKRILITSDQNQKNDIIHFLKDWRLATKMKQLLDSLCPKSSCVHIPKSYLMSRES